MAPGCVRTLVFLLKRPNKLPLKRMKDCVRPSIVCHFKYHCFKVFYQCYFFLSFFIPFLIVRAICNFIKRKKDLTLKFVSKKRDKTPFLFVLVSFSLFIRHINGFWSALFIVCYLYTAGFEINNLAINSG